MAKIANANCKKIYITDDNPRNENPRKIRRQLLKYISKNRAFEVNNRQLAIKKAIINAERSDAANGDYNILSGSQDVYNIINRTTRRTY